MFGVLGKDLLCSVSFLSLFIFDRFLPQILSEIQFTQFKGEPQLGSHVDNIEQLDHIGMM